LVKRRKNVLYERRPHKTRVYILAIRDWAIKGISRGPDKTFYTTAAYCRSTQKNQN